MRVNTRIFGEIDIAEDKIVTLDNGIIGFPELRTFTLIYDKEKDGQNTIMWFQSMDEPEFAMPVMLPSLVKEDYNPTVNDELLMPLGELTEDNLYVLVTVKVPQDIKNISVNLKAPIVINTDTMKGSQLIVEDDVPVRFAIYDILQAAKERAGE